jgi:D-3-phosphoglycerate dehydrogenase
MGAAIEVFPVEPLPADYPFLKLDNVTLPNHRGGDTVNCYSDSPELLLLYLRDLLVNGKKPRFYIE